MSGSLRILIVSLSILMTAHRSPAPIIEPEEKPTTTPSLESEAPKQRHSTKSKTTPDEQPLIKKLKAPAAKKESARSSEQSFIHRFDGTWRGEMSSMDRNGNRINTTRTLLIRNGTTAEWTLEGIGILAAGKTWPTLPAPHNSIPAIRWKETDKSSDLKLEGSFLKVHWPPTKVTDWSPKSIPERFLLTAPYGADMSILLDGNHLIATDGKSTGTLTRVR